MTKRFPYFIALLAITASCSFLDTKIDTFTTPEMAQTRYNTLWAFANAFYAPLQSGFSVLDDNLFAAASDEAIQTATESDATYFNNGTINANMNPVSFLYDNYYEGIRAALFFLDYAKDGEEFLALNRDISGENDIDNQISYEKDVRSLNWYRAEAYVAMAYYYSELIKMYGGVPLVKTLYGDGNDSGSLGRATYDECIDYIVELIDSQLDNLQEDWATHPDNVASRAGRFDKATAMAIKARTLLYAASPRNNPEGDKTKWEKAARAAADLIEFKNYTMPEERNYGGYFMGANPQYDNETIYAVRMEASSAPENANYPITTPGGGSGVTPTENLVSSYEYIGPEDPVDPYKNRDPRLAATIVYNGSHWNGRDIDMTAGGTDDLSIRNTSRTGYYLKKFLTDNLNLTQGETAQHMWVVYRYAEVLLNYAEAMNEAFGPDAVPQDYPMSAREALMQVRNSASLSLPAVTETAVPEFRERVKHERRVELAFEDHRYWDLLRWGDAMEVLNSPVKGVRIGKNSNGIPQYQEREVAVRVFNERNYYMPFTNAEILKSNGKLEQNNGY